MCEKYLLYKSMKFNDNHYCTICVTYNNNNSQRWVSPAATMSVIQATSQIICINPSLRCASNMCARHHTHSHIYLMTIGLLIYLSNNNA